ATTPLAVLRQAAEAPLRTDYEALQVLTVPRAEGAETLRVAVWHRRPATYRMEFLAPRRLAGRLLVDDGLSSWHYEPSLHLLVRGPSLAGAVPGKVPPLPENTTLRLLGNDVVAGRATYLLAVLPASGGPTRRLWVDRSTGLVLKSEAWDAERGVYYTSTVIRISFGPVPEELFRVPRHRGARLVELSAPPLGTRRLSELARAVGFPLAAPADLPEGFRYRGGGVAVLGSTRAALLQYSDGVSTVSLFQVPTGRLGNPPGGGVLRVGSTVVWSYAAGLLRLLVWERRGTSFAVVADAPLGVLRQFVTSAEPDPSLEARRVFELAQALGVSPDRVAELRDRGFTFRQVRVLLAGQPPDRSAQPVAGAGVPSLVDEMERFERVLAGAAGASPGRR
ncbi:MAG: sigma-E factor regulatory protein RseB domain-containing protein, partial [bacterium]